jgi:hypothetical protein
LPVLVFLFAAEVPSLFHSRAPYLPP